MICYDIACFEVPVDLAKRLGYKKIYATGKDIIVVSRPQGGEIPQIVMSRDSGVLVNGLRDIGVIGIIFDGDDLTKKVVEKASELKKTVFVPVGRLTQMNIRERGPKIGRLRKIIFSAHKLGARVRVVTLADSEIALLSTEQIKELGGILIGGGNGASLFGDI